jgi:hypothetical protein
MPSKLTANDMKRWVQTEMGNLGARNAGLEKADVPLDESIEGLMDKVSSLWF